MLRINIALLCLLLVLSGASPAAEISADDLTTSLLAAAQRGDGRTVNLLTRLGANIHDVDKSGNNVVLMAALGGEYQLMRDLLFQGVDPNVRGNSGFTPLTIVAMNGDIMAAQYLLASNADPNLPCSTHDTPLHLAIQYKRNDIVRALLRANANVDKKNDAGDTPLMLAIRTDNREGFDLLLKKHPDFLIQDNENHDILFIAMIENREEMALSLLNAGAPHSVLTGGYTALHWARAMREPKLVEKLEQLGP